MSWLHIGAEDEREHIAFLFAAAGVHDRFYLIDVGFDRLML
jgi:hypothetical protein